MTSKTYYPKSETIGMWRVYPGKPGEDTLATHMETNERHAFDRYGNAVDWCTYQRNLERIFNKKRVLRSMQMEQSFRVILNEWDAIDAAYNEAYGPTNPVLKARWQHKLDYEQARENMAREFIVMAGMLAGKSPATDNALRDSGWEQAQERA